MSRKFITAIAAASIALAGLGASQAHATDKRTRNLVLGAATIAILGAALSAENKNKRSGAYVVTRGDNNYRRADKRYRHTERERHHKHGWDDNRHRWNGHGPKPRPLPKRARRAPLPESCLITKRTNKGRITMYSKNCLDRGYRHAQDLPRSCTQKLWSRDGAIWGYNPTCLRRGGWLDRG